MSLVAIQLKGRKPTWYYVRLSGFIAIPLFVSSVILSHISSRDAAFGADAASRASTANNEVIVFTPDEISTIVQFKLDFPPPPDKTNKVSQSQLAAELGQILFFDKRLSVNGKLSCSSCHDPQYGWSTRDSFPTGLARGHRNTPSLWNVAYGDWYFWDGRSDSLWSQALEPIENESELGSNRLRIARLIAQDNELRRIYEKLFGKMPDFSDERRFPLDARPVTARPQERQHINWLRMTPRDREIVSRIFANSGKAIAAFERRIISRNSQFDLFVQGLIDSDPKKTFVLTDSAKRGLKLFIGKGSCISCHNGPNFTDGAFHDIRIPQHEKAKWIDQGRYAGISRVLKSEFNSSSKFSDDQLAGRLKLFGNSQLGEHWGQFKTPSLRNVALSPPYMHQGQFKTLRDVVEYYSTLKGAIEGEHHTEQVIVALNLSTQEVDDLIAFLESLTDESVLSSLVP